MNEKTELRARDFWTSIVLMAASLFFIYRTADIPFFDTKAAGVDSAEWYNSAALVPYGIFGALALLSVALMVIAIRDGGAKYALSLVGIGFSSKEAIRLTSISIVLFFYIFGLVPRVDFILSSALMITSLIWGFAGEKRFAMILSTSVMVFVSIYAMVMHFPRSEWAKPHDDDWVVLVGFVVLTIIMFLYERRKKTITRIILITPVISILAPLLLVLAMAFGFRQNVPNRNGLLFSKIEYHYYVTLRPIWRGKN
jgi:hypothetical protein